MEFRVHNRTVLTQRQLPGGGMIKQPVTPPLHRARIPPKPYAAKSAVSDAMARYQVSTCPVTPYSSPTRPSQR
jgi:hypothetical protein